MINYCKYRIEKENFIKTFDTPEKCVCWAAKTICFDDYYPIYVTEIVAADEEIEYCGWQPGMKYEFVNSKGETKYCIWLPEYDH